MRRLLAFVCLAFTAVAVGCSGNDATAPSTPNEPATRAVPPPSFATADNGAGLSITTDKDDYQPGDTVWFTGAGWQPGDTLDIVLSDEPATHEPHTWWIPVNETGGFRDSTYVVDVGDLGVTFTLTAASRANPEQALTVQFTDAAPTNVSSTLNGTTFSFPPPPPANQNATNPITVAAGTSVTINVTATTVAGMPGGANWQSTGVSLRVNGQPTFGTESCDDFDVVSNNTVQTTSRQFTFTAPAPASTTKYDVRVRAYIGNGCSGTSGSTPAASEFGVLIVSAANAAPNAPATLAQFKSNGTTSIPTGGLTNEGTVVLKGTVTDPDAGNTVKLQVEVQPVGTTFTNTPTAESGPLASGSTASVTVSGLDDDSYHWQARAVDNNGAASAWASFGGNLESATDFQVDQTPPTVTINQAVGQDDPTNASPINFTVVFSESVSDFATGDVTLSGTAGATTATVTGSGTTYNVEVSEMTGDGTVIATVAAGVASDAAGNANLGSTSTDNTVTYDTTPPAISNFNVSPNPVAVNTLFTISATFIDELSNVTGAEYSLGGTAGPWYALGGSYDSPTENGSTTTSLANPDVLDVCVRSTDLATNTNQTTGTNPIQCIFLAVYDPTAGFVTGGGWIDSPSSACPIFCSGAVGKATFGFVSKYISQKDKTTPVLTGSTEFQFHAGNVNFKSTNYEWLVVSQNGTRAQYKGTGTVNGVPGYGFLLTALESPDRFRMKIWDDSGTIYDNQWDKADSGNDATVLGGGSIIIHVPKK
ncbi:MAG: hypothetical protein ACREOC_00185 [Gemmatimonadales bacterium]